MRVDDGGTGGTLGIVVPTGSPEDIEAAARASRRIAATLGDVGGQLARASVVPSWDGTASVSYGTGMQENAKAPTAAQQAFHLAGAALDTLATALTTAQREARHQVKLATQAESDANAAAVREGAANRRAEGARGRASIAARRIQSASLAGQHAPDAHADHRTALSDASSAEADARAASRDETAAEGRLGAAQRRGEAINETWYHAQQRCAKVLEGLARVPRGMRGAGSPTAATGKGGVPGGELALFVNSPPPGAAGANGGGDNGVGHDLITGLAFIWSGNGNKHFQIRKVASALLMAKGVPKYLKALDNYASWAKLGLGATTDGGQLTLGDAMLVLTHEASPTFNNGLVAKGLSSLASKTPGLTKAGTLLSDASRMSPIFTKIGIAGGVYGTVSGAVQLYKDGNPVKAFEKNPALYATHVTGTAFSASSTAFLIAPNPVTGGAVIVTGVAYAGSEIWLHHKEIEHVGAVAGKAVWHGTEATGKAIWHTTQAVGHALDTGYHDTVHAGSVAVHAVGHVATSGLHDAESGLSKVGHVFGIG